MPDDPDLHYRFFFVQGATVTRIANRLFEDLFMRGLPAAPELAGSTVIVATECYRLANGAPPEVVQVGCMRMRIDGTGAWDLQDQLAHVERGIDWDFYPEAGLPPILLGTPPCPELSLPAWLGIQAAMLGAT